jgi:hypothetical protein
MFEEINYHFNFELPSDKLSDTILSMYTDDINQTIVNKGKQLFKISLRDVCYRIVNNTIMFDTNTRIKELEIFINEVSCEQNIKDLCNLLGIFIPFCRDVTYQELFYTFIYHLNKLVEKYRPDDNEEEFYKFTRLLSNELKDISIINNSTKLTIKI